MRMRVSPHASINVAVPYHAIFMPAIFSYFNRYGSKSQSECQAIGIKMPRTKRIVIPQKSRPPRVSARRAAQNFCFLPTVKLGDDRRIPIGSDISSKITITPTRLALASQFNIQFIIGDRDIRIIRIV